MNAGRPERDRLSQLPTRRWLLVIAIAGAGGVVLYIGSWLVAGMLWEGYDPARQAISELFATDAPIVPARLLEVVLFLTGALLIAFAWMLHRVFPGDALAGPAAVAISGIGTLLVPFVPCSPGCPGAGTTPADSWHTIVAGGGYVALAVAPLLFAHRLRARDPVVARISLVFGVAAVVGFGAYVLGLGGDLGGAIQRAFNTTADLWLLVMAAVALRRLAAQAEGSARSNDAPEPVSES